MSEQSQQKHPKKRRLRRAVFWILVAVLIAGATGWPQRKLFEVAVGKALNAEVEAVGVSLFGHVRAREIRVYDDPGERQKRNATLSLSGFDLDYSLFRLGGSHVPRLHIDEIELNLEGADPANTNYDFLRTLLFGPKTDIDPTPYVPRSTTMGNVRWRCRLPEGGMAIDGLRLEAEFAALDAFSIHLDGDGLTGEWWHKSSPAPVPFEHGQVDARVVRTADRVLLENLRCVLPDAVSLDGAVTLVFLPAELEIDAAFPQFVLHGAPISGLLSVLAGDRKSVV